MPPIKHVRGIEKKPIFRDDADRDNFVERLADVLDMPVESVWEKNRRPQVVKARDLFCFWSSTELGLSATELAKKLGLTPVMQKPERFRVKAPEGEVVVFYFEPSATQNLKFSGFPGG